MSDPKCETETLPDVQRGEGVYLFCFARRALLQEIEGKGVDAERPLVLRGFLDIAAVASMVSLDEFCGSAAESRMKDLSWVGPRACGHEQVVEKVMRQSPVFPARFGTIFSSLESLDKALQRYHDAISQFLDWVADKDEWAVKGLLDRNKAKEDLLSTVLAAHADRLASSPPGMRYFQEQQIRAGVEKDFASWLKSVCKGIADGLSLYASDFRHRKVLASSVPGTELVVNWAFLVPRNSRTEFRTRIDEANADCAQRGLVLEVSGPWPPYSFCPSLERDTAK